MSSIVKSNSSDRIGPEANFASMRIIVYTWGLEAPIVGASYRIPSD